MPRTEGSPSRGRTIDVVSCFAVYLVPLVTGHSLSLTGEYLVRSSSRRGSEAPSWVAMDWAAVLAAQLLFLALLRFGRKLPGYARLLLAMGVLAAFVPVLNTTLLVVIPQQYLIEESTAPPTNTLAEICRADGVDLLPPSSSVYPRSQTARLVVRRFDTQQLALLHIPSCEVRDLDIPETADIGWTSTTGGLLWRRRTTGVTRTDTWFATAPGDVTRTLDVTVNTGGNPALLLDNGGTVAWMERGAPPRIIVVEKGVRRTIETTGVPSGSFGALEGDGPQGPFRISVLGDGSPQWLTIDGAGRVARSIPAPDVVSRFSHHLHPLANGWIAWDLYVEGQRYGLAWMIDGYTTKRELPRGLGVSSVAVDADGTFVAISATSGLNIGRQRDEVWLVRTADGAELFRRYAPKYSRATVALPAGRFFAAGDLSDTRPLVRVYALPTP